MSHEKECLMGDGKRGREEGREGERRERREREGGGATYFQLRAWPMLRKRPFTPTTPPPCARTGG